VVVHELGEHEGNPYIVMEFLDGDPLHRIIYEHTAISLPQKVDIILQVAKALQYAHQKGIIHRDIKPGNISVLRDGTVKVVDFGLAHLAGSDTITRTGVLVGTFSFMSPEQLNGEPVDARSDIFALGIVFYLLLTGKPPFEGSSAAETINKILLEPPARLEHFQNVNQPELQPVLDRALAKKKEARIRVAQSCRKTCRGFAGSSRRKHSWPSLSKKGSCWQELPRRILTVQRSFSMPRRYPTSKSCRALRPLSQELRQEQSQPANRREKQRLNRFRLPACKWSRPRRELAA
jgi:serine/threonine protein kinase